MTSIAYDIETLGTTDNAVLLSLAAVVCPYEDFEYQDLIEKCLFIKFDVNQQVRAGRVVDEDTLTWWEKQTDHAKQVSLLPSKKDVSVEDGFDRLILWMKENEVTGSSNVWVRGRLDGSVTENICKQFGIQLPFKYWQERDVRTAIDCLAPSSVGRGYCKFTKPTGTVIKHDPRHDVCLDVFALRYMA